MTGRPPSIILLANYAPDRQHSMLRFADVLRRELTAAGCRVTVVAPPVVVGTDAPGALAAKWRGYVDKYVLFPWWLRRAIARTRPFGTPVVHVLDHSNAVYTRWLQDVPHLVTCNDLLAVRSARGEFPQNHTRLTGRVLQQWIARGLNAAQRVACISEATRRDVLRLTTLPASAVERVYMGLNWPFRPMPRGNAETLLLERLAATAAPAGRALLDRGFILHVGGTQWYKNRAGVIAIYAALKQRAGASTPALILAGAPLSAHLRRHIRESGLTDDVVEACGVGNEALTALYSTAQLLLFPSLAEGFGWPVLEAMACGCPVVTSGRAPLTEVGGTAAEYIDPDDVEGAAAVVARVLNESPDRHRQRAADGLAQCRIFSTDAMVRQYLELYRAVAAEGPMPALTRRAPHARAQEQ